MFDKLQSTVEYFEEISKKICDPEIISDNQLFTKLMKEQSELTPIVEVYREYQKAKDDYEGALEMSKGEVDMELKELIEIELNESKQKQEKLEEELKILLLPRDPNDNKNVIVEIRAGAGGDEAALFGNVLYRMYTMYAASKRWKVEVMEENLTELGGCKEIVFQISGKDVYGQLKYESGVHRVQRVPETEASGRIHTSTVTVAVLPEVEEVEVEINQSDLRIDVYRASGAGGQHVNKTESAVRITHIPTGVVVACQSERSQFQNKDACMRILRSRIYEMMQEEKDKEYAQTRKSQVGTGDRSERIRTYNYPQGRVTDHRIGLTLHRLEYILNGDLQEIVDALNIYDQSEKLKMQAE